MIAFWIGMGMFCAWFIGLCFGFAWGKTVSALEEMRRPK